jgi:uncharacterized protein (TIGR03086 family)
MHTATDLLDQGYAWTIARIAAVPADGLDAPTPCGLWNLHQLLDHTIDTLAVFTDAISDDLTDTAAPDRPAPGPAHWLHAMAELANRGPRAWKAPGVMDRTLELPFGTMPAPVAASANLLELVVHGWDISQATGEAAEIPDALALPVLEFARAAIPDTARGEAFGVELDLGDTPSDRLVAFLGRKPL